jgi:Icc-related predicted phosphoesterase
MPVKIVSDLHSAVEALRREVSHEDTLLLLGDLVNIIDYLEMDGILVEVFGIEAVKRVVELRAQKRFDEARAFMASRREGKEGEVWTTFRSLQTEAYSNVRQSLPHKTYLIPGNIDSPEMLESMAGPGVELIDGKVIDIEGMRIGFAGGGLPTPLGVAGEISEEEYNAKLDEIGEVDVLCSHVPPDLPELTFDTLARRSERGSSYLLEYIKQVQPIRVFFGHIHQPLLSSTHVGRTHLVNAGYFRRTERALTLWV